MAALQIVCADSCAGAALAELLKFLKHALAFFFRARAGEHNSQVVQGRFVIWFSCQRFAERRGSLLILLLLHVNLANVDVGRDVFIVDCEHALKFFDCVVEPIVDAGNQSQDVMRLRRARVLGQGFFSCPFRILVIRNVVEGDAQVDLRKAQSGINSQCMLE